MGRVKWRHDHLITAKIRCLKTWTGREISMEKRYKIKVNELRKAMCKIEYGVESEMGKDKGER